MAIVSPKPKHRRRTLLKRLVYEVADGQPIYYKGYREVLAGHTRKWKCWKA